MGMTYKIKPKKFVTPSGEIIYLHTIGYFAKEVDRTTACIRMWEREHYIPETPFRDSSGRRLYSDEQIAVVKKFLLKYNMKHGKVMKNTYFAKNVFNHWGKLKERYLSKGAN